MSDGDIGVDVTQPKLLGKFAFKRLQILGALKVGHTVDSLKEQLREIEKQMVQFGWDGKAHIVVMTGSGPRIQAQPKTKGNIINVTPFNMNKKSTDMRYQ